MTRDGAPEPRIRLVDARDFKALCEFFCRNNVPETTSYFHPFPLTDETAAAICAGLHLDRYYCAFIGDPVVGLCMLRGWDAGFEIPSYGVLIDARARGSGLGLAMTQFALEEAARLGCPSLRLTVYAGNAAALRIYRRLNFVESGRAPCVVAGRPDTTIVMHRVL